MKNKPKLTTPTAPSTGPAGKVFGQYWLILISNLPKLASGFCWMAATTPRPEESFCEFLKKNWKSDGVTAL